MILIRVKYDTYNRQFVLVDREMARSLEDGETYMLVAEEEKTAAPTVVEIELALA
jgi:hypothetical protein